MSWLKPRESRVVYEDDRKMWINKKGQLHRENGPAVEWPDGYKQWYLNNKLHREDGPAVEWSDGYNQWYLNGINFSEEDWKRQLGK